MQLDATITKVEDIMEITQYNIMATPALVINGKVVLKGVLPSKVQLQTILSTN